MWKRQDSGVYRIQKPDGYNVSFHPFSGWKVCWSIYARDGNKRVAEGHFMVDSFGDEKAIELAKKIALAVYEEIVYRHIDEPESGPEFGPVETNEYVPVKVGRGRSIHAAVKVEYDTVNYLSVFCGADRCTTGHRWKSQIHTMEGYKVTCKRCIKNVAGHPGAAEALRIEIDNAS